MAYLSKRRELLYAAMRVLLDLSCIIGVFMLTVLFLMPEGATSVTRYAIAHLPYLSTLSLVWLLVATDQRLFLSRRSEAMVALLFSVAKAFATAFLFTVFIVALFTQEHVERSLFAVLFVPAEMNRTFLFFFGLCALGGLLLCRLALGLSLWNLRRRGFNSRRILIIGSNERTQKLVDILHANEQYGYHIEGFLELDPSRRTLLEDRGIPYLGELETLDQILVSRVIDAVYIALPVRSYYEKIQSAAHLCEGVGVPVRFMADLFPLKLATSEMSRLGDVPLLSLSTETGSRTQFALHRAVDMGVSSLLLVVLSPVLIAAAIAIKLDSKGPVMVRRERRGAAGPYHDLVFRTTPPDASGSDAPLTRVGRLLRRYGVDELPQLFSVLVGDISLAGPAGGQGQAAKVDSPV